MAVREVIVDGETLISLKEDTVTEDTLEEGITAHDARGKQITGKLKKGAMSVVEQLPQADESYYGTFILLSNKDGDKIYACIKADNGYQWEQINDSDAVKISDIVDNLITNATKKPLSAAQGVALKAMIDAIKIPDIINDLTTDEADKTLSAAQGVALKKLIDAIKVPTTAADLGIKSEKWAFTLEDGTVIEKEVAIL